MVVEILQLVHEIRCSKKRLSERFSDKHKEQASGGVQSKDGLKNFVKFTEKKSLPESPFWKESAAVKHVALKNFANFTGKNLCWSLFLTKLEF